MSVYSQHLFGSSALTTSSSTVLTVPASSTYVIRMIVCYQGGGTLGSIFLFRGSDSSPIFKTTAAGLNQLDSEEGRFVIGALDTVKVSITSGTWALSLDGYNLT